MSAEPLWFRNVVEGLFVRGLGGSLTPELRASLKQAGLDVERLLPAYPVHVLEAALALVGPLVAPGATRDAQHHALGVLAATGYFDTLVGRAIAAGARLLGPARGVDRLDRNLRFITNHLTARVVSRAPSSAVVELFPVDRLCHFVVGLLQGASALGEAGTRAELLSHSGPECQVRLRW